MQNIVITGASSGMGMALKEYYQKRGDKVYNISLAEADFNCDVTDRAKMEEAFKDIKEKFDRIDMLVHQIFLTSHHTHQLILNHYFHHNHL